MKYFTFFSGFLLVILGVTYMWRTILLESYEGDVAWFFFFLVLVCSAFLAHFLSLLFSRIIYK